MIKSNSKGKKTFIITAIVLVLLASLLWYSCVVFIYLNKTYGNYNENSEVKYIAHRGLSSEYYQNTYEAFYYASKRSFFTGIECDIWRTKDGIWVCCHDNNPFINKSVFVTESNYEDIKDLPLDTSDADENVDIKNAHLTLFIDYLSIFKQSSKIAFIELKQDYEQEQIDELIQMVDENLNIYRVYFCSFEFNVIKKVLNYNKNLNTMLFSNNKIYSYFYKEMGYNVGYNKNLLEKIQTRIEKHHNKNSFVNVYTINDINEAQKFIEMGVDYITTDVDFSKL